MNVKIPIEVLKAFTNQTPALPDHPTGKINIDIIGGGLINHSYKITAENDPGFLLQQINKHVFEHPEHVQENYLTIWQHVKDFTGLHLPAPRYYNKKATLFVDEQENYWRAFEFISDARMVSIAEKPSQAKTAAKAFAGFTSAFADFNVQLLKTVIPDFHNLHFRYNQFEKASKGELNDRMVKGLPLSEELKQRERYKRFYGIIIGSGEFPQRVMHHDAKIANVLFSQKTGEIICLVDFDTVMPGHYFSDLGDMIRSISCSHDENSTDFEDLHIRKDFYEAIVSGYLEVMNEQLTESEKKYIHYAGLLMIYMQALRFLTDYLENDKYYRVTYPEQNYDRAKNQLVLLKSLEDFLKSEYKFSV